MVDSYGSGSGGSGVSGGVGASAGARVSGTEAVLYSVPKKMSTVFLSKFLVLVLLSGLFYAGILLNISLLSLRRATESNAKIGALMIVVFLLFFGLISNFVKAKHPIVFLQTGVKLSKHKTLLFSEISSVERKRGIFDRIFSSYHLRLNKKYVLEGIDNSVDLETYLNQLVAYAHQQSAQSGYGYSSQMGQMGQGGYGSSGSYGGYGSNAGYDGQRRY